ncbi:recombination protein RecR [Parvularcula sp. ZS-1/3]|uniref:Recombination protein RecR n=1 Tax=Parvularcula mediterranea TaxID=2732508 RepID=A0A7Y3W531_9PROT|nr:recombination mediator RecR [Parvularcula mediterranea]NNU15816.1 recombination protein RecR [Parvularcula mediterranea]
MPRTTAGPELDHLISLLSKLPGYGPRSATRAALHMLRKRDAVMRPLADALSKVAETVKACSVCGNWDASDPCTICSDEARDRSVICVVQDVSDVWALERARAHRGLYHILGGVISPLDGIGPDDLRIDSLSERASEIEVREIILGMSATVDGQTTAHYVTERLEGRGLTITRMAHGVPVGGELDVLDEGTLAAALKARRPF